MVLRFVFGLILVIWMGWWMSGCENTATQPLSGKSLVLVKFTDHPASVPENQRIRFSLRAVDSSASRKSTVFRKNSSIKSITSGKIVFFDLGIDRETLEQNLSDSTIQSQLEEFHANLPAMTSFEQYVGLQLQSVKIVTRNAGGIEQQGELEIANGMARGLFWLTEGMKSAAIGLFEDGNLVYVGNAEHFEAVAGDTAYAYIFLEYTGPISMDLFSPQNNDSTYDGFIAVSGNIQAGVNYPYDLLHLKMRVNDEYEQMAQVNYYGNFTTTALLTRRTNTIQVTARDPRTGETASGTVTVRFVGDFAALRATLSWDGPGDLDLSMKSPDSLECSPAQPNIGGMVMDVINYQGYGPESISVLQPVTGGYRVFVANRGQVIGVTATVRIYRYNPNSDMEELIDTQTHYFDNPNPWTVGVYQP